MQRLKKITYIYYFELSRTRLIYNHLYAVALSPIYYLVIIKCICIITRLCILTINRPFAFYAFQSAL